MNDEQRISRAELRVSQNGKINFRHHLAQLHLFAAVAETYTPSTERWQIYLEQHDGLGVIAVELRDGTPDEAARAISMLQAVVGRLGARMPRFPLLGAQKAIPSPFVDFEMATDVTDLKQPRLIIRAPDSLGERQLRCLLHLLAAATELSSSWVEAWDIQIVLDKPGIGIVQIDLPDCSPDPANRASEVLEHVLGRCEGAPIGGFERLAAPLVQEVWPAIADEPWARHVALQLWA